MSGSFYADMADVATDVLTEFNQGAVVLIRTETASPNPDTPWKPRPIPPTSYPLQATVRRVEQKYVDGSLIVATDDQITFAVPEVTPRMTDAFTVDGLPRVIKDLRPIPASGTPVAYIAFVGH